MEGWGLVVECFGSTSFLTSVFECEGEDSTMNTIRPVVQFGTAFQILAPGKLIGHGAAKRMVEDLERFGSPAKQAFVPELDSHIVLTGKELKLYNDAKEANDTFVALSKQPRPASPAQNNQGQGGFDKLSEAEEALEQAESNRHQLWDRFVHLLKREAKLIEVDEQGRRVSDAPSAESLS